MSKMEKLKYSKGKKARYNVMLDTGIVAETKKLLGGYNGNFSGLINERLDQWCQDETALDVINGELKDLEKKQKKEGVSKE